MSPVAKSSMSDRGEIRPVSDNDRRMGLSAICYKRRVEHKLGT